jgi:3-oxoacyl-[acyl-carrier-protein] synthase-1
MVSPVGVNATQTFTSVRANIPRKQARPDLYLCMPEDPDLDESEPLVASPISHLDCVWRAQGRQTEWLALLAARAFADLWNKAKLTADDEGGTGLFLSLPGPRPDWGPEQGGAFTEWFHNLAAHEPFAHRQLSWMGSGGALDLCTEACRLVREGQIKRAIVGGVDSHLFPEWLAPLDRAYRISSTRSHDGFCPGEAAAFFLLEPAAEAQRRALQPWAELGATATATCTATAAGHDAGATLADVLSRVIPAGAAAPPLVVCDLNGEMSRAREWGYALSRLGNTLRAPLALEHPAAVLGDLGAASGAALVVLAAHYLHTKHRDRNSAVLWTASDGGERHAILLARPQPPCDSPLGP